MALTVATTDDVSRRPGLALFEPAMLTMSVIEGKADLPVEHPDF